jgi:hypothetical protein
MNISKTTKEVWSIHMEGGKEVSTEIGGKIAKQTRQRSTIGFPYTDLAACVGMAGAIHTHVGLGDCDDHQLAAWMNQSAKSSGFLAQVYAARKFGILAGEGSNHKLTDLGRSIVDPNQMREAKTRAFLAVPLFKAIYDKYKGGVIPPAAALERDMATLGVSDKQKGRARQVFEKSAEEAGFFEHGKNRLVMPGVVTGPGANPIDSSPIENVTKPIDKGGGTGGGGGDIPDIDPIIRGLLARLPPTGSVWAETERTLWLELLKGSFKLIYKGEAAGRTE